MRGALLPAGRPPSVILVVGLPRSGTTWAARALAEATQRGYVHEPFNWIRDSSYESLFLRYFPTGSPLGDLRGGIRTVTKRGNWAKRLVVQPRLVVKEVHAILAVERISEELRSQVVLIARHPCGVAASWSAIGFDPQWNLEKLLGQRDLFDGPLGPFRSWLQSSSDPFFVLGALWGAVHHVLGYIADRHPDWLWVSHERLCGDPVEFERLLAALDLGANEPDVGALRGFLSRSNRKPTSDEGPYSVSRVTKNEPEKWRDLLTLEQQEAVLEGSRPFRWPAVLADECLQTQGTWDSRG